MNASELGVDVAFVLTRALSMCAHCAALHALECASDKICHHLEAAFQDWSLCSLLRAMDARRLYACTSSMRACSQYKIHRHMRVYAHSALRRSACMYWHACSTVYFCVRMCNRAEAVSTEYAVHQGMLMLGIIFEHSPM